MKLFKSISIGILLAGLPVISVFAQSEAAAPGKSSLTAIGAGIAIGLAVLGGGIGQGRAAAAALEGLSRNPGASGKIFTPFILAMALIESLVIFALLIAFVILGG